MWKVIVLGACALSLSGCATIVSGTTEQVAFVTNPPGGDCTLVRKGITLGTIHAPGSMVIKKTKDDINVTCTKKDYLPSTAFMKSKVQDSAWGNLILGGVIGAGIDAANGAINKYDTPVTVTMVPDMKNAQPITPAAQNSPTQPTESAEKNTPAAAIEKSPAPATLAPATAAPTAPAPATTEPATVAPTPAIAPVANAAAAAPAGATMHATKAAPVSEQKAPVQQQDAKPAQPSTNN